MYCPKCMISIDNDGAGTCPHCATPLFERPAPLSTPPVDHANWPSSADLQAGEGAQAGMQAGYAGLRVYSVKEQFYSLENKLGDTDSNSANTCNDIILNSQVRSTSSNHHESHSRELLDKAFEAMHNDQRAYAPGSKSLAVTALLGVLLLMSFIGTGIYYLNHTKAHKTALQTPAKILILPSSDTAAPTLKNVPLILIEQQSQNGTIYTAQDGSPAKQDLSIDQTPVKENAGQISDSAEQKGAQDITTKAVQTDDPAVLQREPPSSEEVPQIAGTSQAPPAEKYARHLENKKGGSGAIASTRSGNLNSQANDRTNAESGTHILLCGSFQNKEKAYKQAAKIKSKGYKTFVEKADLGSKGIWYRIKIDGFISKDAAEKARGELNRTLKLETVVSKRR